MFGLGGVQWTGKGSSRAPEPVEIGAHSEIGKENVGEGSLSLQKGVLTRRLPVFWPDSQIALCL